MERSRLDGCCLLPPGQNDKTPPGSLHGENPLSFSTILGGSKKHPTAFAELAASESVPGGYQRRTSSWEWGDMGRCRDRTQVLPVGRKSPKSAVPKKGSFRDKHPRECCPRIQRFLYFRNKGPREKDARTFWQLLPAKGQSTSWRFSRL